MVMATKPLPISKDVKSETTSRLYTRYSWAHSCRVPKRWVSITCSDQIIMLQGTCAQKLARQKILVLQPEKIKTIADVSVVCFDKTGTLTGSVVSCFLMHAPCNREAQSIPFLGFSSTSAEKHSPCSSLLSDGWQPKSALKGASRYMILTAAPFDKYILIVIHIFMPLIINHVLTTLTTHQSANRRQVRATPVAPFRQACSERSNETMNDCNFETSDNTACVCICMCVCDRVCVCACCSPTSTSHCQYREGMHCQRSAD